MKNKYKLIIYILIGLIIGIGIGYLITVNNYSSQIKGLEEGLKISCDGLNEINEATNQLSYLTGIYTQKMDCIDVVQNWRNKYKMYGRSFYYGNRHRRDK